MTALLEPDVDETRVRPVRRRTGPRRGSRLAPYLGFVPIGTLMIGFFAAPLALIGCYSFWKVIDQEVVHDWTFDNYSYLLTVPTYAKTLWASVWMACLATLLIICIAVPVVYWLVRYVSPKRRRLLLILIIAPFWTSYLLRVTAWTTILGDRGLVNRALISVGVVDEPLSFLLYNRVAVLIVLVYLYFPFAALTLYASMESFDWTQFSAAADLGASAVRRWRWILLPQMKTGLVTAAVFSLIPILGEYLAPQMVGGTKGVMIGNLIVNFFQSGQYARGAAVALIIAALVACVLILCRRSLDVGKING